MKVLYLHQYFKTPEEGGAIRSYYIAKAMVQYGWEVEMITAHSKEDYQFKDIEGVKVHYLPVAYNNSMSFFERIRSFSNYNKKAFSIGKKIKDADFIYATSTPLTIGKLALHLSNKLHIPYFFEVRDLWPEAPIQMGVISNSFLISQLRKLERKIYSKAKGIVGLSPGIINGIEQKLENSNHIVIPNMCDKYLHVEDSMESIKKPFHVLYMGTLGAANGPDRIVSLVQKNNSGHIHFQFMANGAYLEEVQTKLRVQSNVTFRAYVSKAELAKVLKTVDACFVSFKDLEVLQTCSPNKFFDGLAAGKIIITNTKGWFADLIIEHNCGFVVEDDSDITKMISPSDIAMMKENALRLSERFEKGKLTTELIDFIKKSL